MTEGLTPAQARHKHKETCARFMAAYPRHTHHTEAANAWSKLMEQGEDPVRIVKAAKAYAETNPDLKYVSAPHRWLENGRYDDADLFADESAAQIAWLKQMWRDANVRAVENRYHVTMPKQYPDDTITSPDAIRFWHKQRARSWITSVAMSKGAQTKSGGQSQALAEATR